MSEPDSKVTPGQEADPLAVYLAEAGEHAVREQRFVLPGTGPWSCQDVPRLVGAVQIALKLADDWMAVGPPPRTAEERARRACGLLLYRDITAELLREVRADGN